MVRGETGRLTASMILNCSVEVGTFGGGERWGYTIYTTGSGSRRALISRRKYSSEILAETTARDLIDEIRAV